jgi:hypothetical protein
VRERVSEQMAVAVFRVVVGKYKNMLQLFMLERERERCFLKAVFIACLNCIIFAK